MTRPDVLYMTLTYLGADTEDALKEMEDTIRCHARFVFLENMYTHHLNMAVEVNRGDAPIRHHRECALRSYLIYFVETSIFVDNSAYYVDVVYLRHFIDFDRIHEYKWGSRLFGLPILEVR